MFTGARHRQLRDIGCVSLVLSTSGAVAKLLALQVFCLVVILSPLLSSALLRRQLPALKIILGVKLALLIANAALTIHFGPFSNGDDVPAVLTGMVLIAAMAIQNAAHRIHLGRSALWYLSSRSMAARASEAETGVPGQRLAHMDTAWVLWMQG
jgi:hypothetical protein